MTSTVFVDEQTVIRASWLNDVNADVYGVRPVSTGGTGASDAATARTNLGLGNVDNTSDADKPVSTATQTALNLKFDKSGGTVTGNMTVTGNAALGDAEASDTHAIKGATTLLANSASAALRITQTGAGNAFVVEDSASIDATPFVISNVGRIIHGHTTEVAVGSISNQSYQLHGAASNGLPNASAITWYSGAAISGIQSYARSKSDTIGSHTIVASGDDIHTLSFYGSDGTAFLQTAAIKVSVDGTPGTNDMPGRLVFSTTADGAASPTERMRIDSAGLVTLAQGQIKFPATQNASADANTLDDYEEGAWTPIVTFGGAAVGVTYTTQVGRYTKVGRLVSFQGSITLSSKGSSTGTALITALPFINDSAVAASCSLRFNTVASGVGDTMIAGHIAASTSAVTLVKYATGSASLLTDADFTNTTSFMVEGTFTV